MDQAGFYHSTLLSAVLKFNEKKLRLIYYSFNKCCRYKT